MCLHACWMTWTAIFIFAHSPLLTSSHEVPVEKIVAAPGSDAVLSCLFPANTNVDFEMLVINWQHGDNVVHSFYRHRDQLEKQNEVYKGRTSLFQEQLQAGNASLLLTDIQPEHNGNYKCFVTYNNGPYEQTVHLLVAAPYDEPEIEVQYLCENIIISLSSHGFPKPVVTWSAPLGYENTTLKLDSKGHYRLQSNMTMNLNSTEIVKVEMSLDVLSQKFSRALTLHPHLGCEEQSPRCRIGCGIAIVGLMTTVIMLLLQRK